MKKLLLTTLLSTSFMLAADECGQAATTPPASAVALTPVITGNATTKHYPDIFAAAKNGDFSAVQEFIHKGVDCTALNDDEETALFDAARSGNLDIVKYFVEDKKVDYTALNDNGGTVLHCAARSGNLNMVKYFVEDKKVDCTALNDNGETVLHYAAESGNLDMVKYLIEVKGTDYTVVDCFRNTILHYAAESGNLALVKYLAEDKGVNSTTIAMCGMTVLSHAVPTGNLALVKYLVEDKGADCTLVDLFERTAVSLSIICGKWKIAVYLADIGAPVPSENQEKINQHRRALKQQASASIVNRMMRKQLIHGIAQNARNSEKSGIPAEVWQRIYTFIDPSELTRDQFISGQYMALCDVDEWNKYSDARRKAITMGVQESLDVQYLIKRLEHHRLTEAVKKI